MSALENLTKSLRLKELKHLSAQLGLNVTGNKAALRAQILSLSLPAPQQQQQQQDSRGKRILSIDMGIRNMAYCVLDLPADAPQRPIVRHWTRQAVPLYSAPPRPEPSGKTTAATVAAPTAMGLPQLAAAAHALAHGLMAAHAPDHVLIERQRWRSASSKGVLEWTIRVNTLEAMLHAVLYTLRLQGHGPDGWTCESVDPGRVWSAVASAGGGHGGEGRVTSGMVKTLKKRVVRQWLREGNVIDLADGPPGSSGGSVLDAQELMLLSDGQSGAKRNGQRLTAADRKVDDLADCLMQAVVWLRWQQNRRGLLEGRLPDAADVAPPLLPDT